MSDPAEPPASRATGRIADSPSASRSPAEGLLGGAMVGLAGGLFGVGGGILMVPLLTGRYRLTQHQAHGTSLAVIAFTALTATLVYGLGGNVAWDTALLAGVGSILTAR